MPVALWTVTRLEPGCSFDWESVVPGLRSRGGHRVEAGPGGRSRVTLTFDWSGWLAPLLRLAAGGIARRFVRAEAEGLKRRCEHDFTEGSGIDAREA
jgi:hypothetical protein